MRWAGPVVRMEEMINANILVGKAAHVKPRRILEDNIQMNLIGIGYEDVNCIHLALYKTRNLLTS
jgi:hypothetical protein